MRIAMMEITTYSSTKVKPRDFMVVLYHIPRLHQEIHRVGLQSLS